MNSRAYYNENNLFAAAWLRELIKDGAIAPGDVDERSIEDVRPIDLVGYTQCHFFAGIGVWSYALRLAGWPDDRPVWTGSCPCPPFSVAGKKKSCPECGSAKPLPHAFRTGIFRCTNCGHDWYADGRHLWPEFYRLIKERRPLVVLGEQVAGSDGLAWGDIVQATLELERYAVGRVPFAACGVGAPHIRQRLYWMAHTPSPRHQRPIPVAEGQTQDETRLCMPGAQCGSCRLADTLSTGWPEWRSGTGDGQTTGRGRSGRVADAAMRGRQPFPHQQTTGICPEKIVTGEPGIKFSPHGASVLRMGNSNTSGSQACECASLEREGRREERGTTQQPDGPPHRLDNALRNGWGESRDHNGEYVREQSDATSNALRPGPVNGFWRDADWLFCRDGKWRPVVASHVALVDGSPSGVVRMCPEGSSQEKEEMRSENMPSLQEDFATEAFFKRNAGTTLQQRPCEFEDVVHFLPPSLALAELYGSRRTAEELLTLRNAIYEAGSLLHPSESVQEIWASLGEEEKNRLKVGFDASRWQKLVSFPLEHKAENRAGRLGAYGNAINAEAAAEFIRAAMWALDGRQ